MLKEGKEKVGEEKKRYDVPTRLRPHKLHQNISPLVCHLRPSSVISRRLFVCICGWNKKQTSFVSINKSNARVDYF